MHFGVALYVLINTFWYCYHGNWEQEKEENIKVRHITYVQREFFSQTNFDSLNGNSCALKHMSRWFENEAQNNDDNKNFEIHSEIYNNNDHHTEINDGWKKTIIGWVGLIKINSIVFVLRQIAVDEKTFSLFTYNSELDYEF